MAFKPGKAGLHPVAAWCALGAGAVGLLAWIAFALGGNPLAARIGVSIGMWWLLALFMVVGHRMIPFFSGLGPAQVRGPSGPTGRCGCCSG